MLIGAPMARFATVITIGRPSPDALGSASAMKSSPWLARGRVGPGTGGRRADARRERAELGLDHEVLTRSQLARADQLGEGLDDVGLRGDRVRRHDVRAALRAIVSANCARDLELLTHGRRGPLAARTVSLSGVWAARDRVPGADVASDLPPANRRRIALSTASGSSNPVSLPRHRRVRCWAAAVRGARGHSSVAGTVTPAGRPRPETTPDEIGSATGRC